MAVSAFAPASVTTVFVPRPDSGGSLGVSFALEDGVTVTVETASTSTVRLAGEPTAIEPVTGVLDRLDVTAQVDVEPEVPIGCGFGVSGAATLGTALAAAVLVDLDQSREALVQAAHQAELAAGTGQGDVFIQDRGGLVWNAGEGVQRLPREDRLAYTAFGSVDTAAVLADADAGDRIAAAGHPALEAFDPKQPLATWFGTAWQFALKAGLPTDRVREAVAGVEAEDGAATMAMLGETVIGTPTGAVLDEETAISPEGARVR